MKTAKFHRKTARLLLVISLLFLAPFPLLANEPGSEQIQQQIMDTEPMINQGSVTSEDNLYTDKAGTLQKRVPGVGSTLASILDQLSSITDGSENKIKHITNNLPYLFPDLYKVFVTL